MVQAWWSASEEQHLKKKCLSSMWLLRAEQYVTIEQNNFFTIWSSDQVVQDVVMREVRNPAALINISRVAKISLVTSRLDSWLWELHPIYIFLQLLFIYAYKMFGRNPRRMFSYLDISFTSMYVVRDGKYGGSRGKMSAWLLPDISAAILLLPEAVCFDNEKLESNLVWG